MRMATRLRTRLVEDPHGEATTTRHKNKPLGSRGIAVLFLLLTLPLLPAVGAGAEGKKPRTPAPWTGPVPKADCGPDDRVETGLQGQTTPAERESGAVDDGFNCNLELVGQFQGEGAGYGFAWFDDCAYYGTANTPQQQRRGTVVVDVSDPRNPQSSAVLNDTSAMLDLHESLKVHNRRQLLAGVERDGPGFAIYDLSADCRHPVLEASIELADSVGHAGDFTPDGRTYYATQNFRGLGGIMPIVDVSDPSNRSISSTGGSPATVGPTTSRSRKTRPGCMRRNPADPATPAPPSARTGS
jgi:hypothetical protein